MASKLDSLIACLLGVSRRRLPSYASTFCVRMRSLLVMPVSKIT